jgi:hypothetical protein
VVSDRNPLNLPWRWACLHLGEICNSLNSITVSQLMLKE